jgi:hypothetical protein
MTRVSLTQFADFTTATGASRLTQVRKIKRQQEAGYSPATDYWKPLRDGIETEFQRGWEGAASLRRLRDASQDPKKQERYAQCIEGLGRWAKRKAFGRSRRKPGTWTSGELTVAVNPEIALDINGDKTAVKLYFRQEQLSKPRVDTLLHLLKSTVPGNVAPAILDVARGKLIVETVEVPDLDIVLEADAVQFMALWKRLSRA